MGDPFRLKQIMSNLVGNAVKFTDAGYVKCAINLIEEYDNKVKLEMSVKDTGIGINKQEILKVFDKFTQSDDSHTRLYGGTGIGACHY